MYHRALLLGAVFAVLLPLAPAAAQPSEEVTAAAIKARIANYREMGTAFKAFEDQFKSDNPYLPALQQAASQIASLGQDLPKWFPPGSGPEPGSGGGFLASIKALFTGGGATVAGEKTMALAEVWTRPEQFRTRHQAFLAEATRMDEIARTGDLAAIKSQVKPLGESCGACHNDFRAED